MMHRVCVDNWCEIVLLMIWVFVCSIMRVRVHGLNAGCTYLFSWSVFSLNHQTCWMKNISIFLKEGNAEIPGCPVRKVKTFYSVSNFRFLPFTILENARRCLIKSVNKQFFVGSVRLSSFEMLTTQARTGIKQVCKYCFFK